MSDETQTDAKQGDVGQLNTGAPDGGSERKRGRVTNSEVMERMEALDRRLSELDERERAIEAREAALSPREREADFSTRSRAADETKRLERLSMDHYSPTGQMEIPEDDTYYYRWIAEYVNGYPTPGNVQKRIRAGFARVRIDELPEDFIVDEDERGDGYARNSGLVLMRVPHQRKEAIDRYYLNRSIERLESADELQGIANRDYVREDRGSRSLTGRDAQAALSQMSQT